MRYTLRLIIIFNGTCINVKTVINFTLKVNFKSKINFHDKLYYIKLNNANNKPFNIKVFVCTITR